MGRVHTKTVKKSSVVVVERYYPKMTLDFHTNKKILEEVAIIPTKRLRNKIAGYSAHLMKRIQKGPVRGISLKLQEEERDRCIDFVPDESAIRTDVIEVDKETIDMLVALGMVEYLIRRESLVSYTYKKWQPTPSPCVERVSFIPLAIYLAHRLT
ncbi:40S ribosomal protein S17 [Tanacetum coccineum]